MLSSVPVALVIKRAGYTHSIIDLVEVDRDPMVEMCLSIDGYSTGRTSPTVRSNVGRFSGQVIEDLRSI